MLLHRTGLAKRPYPSTSSHAEFFFSPAGVALLERFGSRSHPHLVQDTDPPVRVAIERVAWVRVQRAMSDLRIVFADHRGVVQGNALADYLQDFHLDDEVWLVKLAVVSKRNGP